ncbi:FAD-binding oxidoreductase [Jatrophihabitans sp. YIM 134969]
MSTTTGENTLPARVDRDATELAHRVTGEVLRRDSAGYEEACVGYNLAAVRRPDLVVRARSADDVAAAVDFAASHDLPVAVMATGHQAGRPIEQGVLIRTDALRQVEIDPERRRAWVGAGARFEDVLEASLPHGLAPLHGSSPSVGVVGFTLGGGISPVLGRTHGWAVDHVRTISVVSADGSRIDATADAHPELFWALRGGRSNLGVVTAMEIDLVEVGAFAGGGLFFDGAHTAEVLAAFQALTVRAPEELTVSLALLRMPPLPGIPPLLAGRFTLHLRVAYLGDAADVDPLLAPVRAAAPVLLDTVGPLPYDQFASIHSDPVDPAPFVERSTLLRDLPPAALAAVVDVAGPASGVGVEIVELRHLGGAMSRPPEVSGAIDLYDARFSVWCAVVGGPGERPDAVADADRVVAALTPWSTGLGYLNFAGDDDAAGSPFRPDALRRLRAVKAVADSRDLFRLQHPLV